MAEETINKAIDEGFLEKRKCVTSRLKLTSLNDNNSAGRFHIYGEGFSEINKIISEEPAYGIPIDPRLPFTRAEILWICRNEMPVNIEDILARRTRSLILNARASADMAPEVARLMAQEFGYTLDWQQEQVRSYNDLVKNYL
jgi:glycerol-3-phosphate dehydrogenase